MRRDDEHKKSLGRMGEDIACAFMESRGMYILDRNVHMGHKEVDIICMEGRTLRFVEVKTRQIPVEGEAWEAVDYSKKRNLAAAARAYVLSDKFKSHRLRYDEILFDIVTLTFNESGTHYEIEYIPDAYRLFYV